MSILASDWGPPRLESISSDPDCGCPVEAWVYGGVDLILHFEPDGTMELHADNGDWDASVALAASTMEEARREAFAWVDALPCEDDGLEVAA